MRARRPVVDEHYDPTGGRTAGVIPVALESLLSQVIDFPTGLHRWTAVVSASDATVIKGDY